MDVAPTQALAVPLTADEQDQVQHAATVAGCSLEEFARTALLVASQTRFLTAIEQAATTIATRNCASAMQHDYAL